MIKKEISNIYVDINTGDDSRTDDPGDKLCAGRIFWFIKQNPQEGVTEYKYSAESDSQKGVALKVEWNEPKLGEDTTFHVSADGGSGRYLFRMDAPSLFQFRVSIVLNPWRIQAAERGFNIQMSVNLTTLNSQ